MVVKCGCSSDPDNTLLRDEVTKKRPWKRATGGQDDRHGSMKRPRKSTDLKNTPSEIPKHVISCTNKLTKAEPEEDPFGEIGLTQVFRAVEESEAELERQRRSETLTEDFEDGADAVEELAANSSSFDTIYPEASKQCPMQAQITNARHPLNPDLLAHVRQCLIDLGFNPDSYPRPLVESVKFRQHAYKIEEKPVTLSITEDREMIVQTCKGDKAGSVKVLFRKRSVAIPDDCKVLRPDSKKGKSQMPQGLGYIDRWVQKGSFSTDTTDERETAAK